MKLAFLLFLLLLFNVGSTASRRHHHSRRMRFFPGALSPSATLWAPPPTPGVDHVVVPRDDFSPSSFVEVPDPGIVVSSDRELSPDPSPGQDPLPTFPAWHGSGDAPVIPWMSELPPQELSPAAAPGDDEPPLDLSPWPSSGGDDGSPSSTSGGEKAASPDSYPGDDEPYDDSPPAPPDGPASLPVYLPPAVAGATGRSGSGKLWTTWLMAVVIGSGVMTGAVLFSGAFIAYRVLRKRKGAAAVRPWKSGMSGGMSGQMQKAFVTAIPAISRAEVEAACEDFSNIIGTSPDSVVFKGTLECGTEVAVTSIRMEAESWTPKSEIFFRLKVESLARMSHTHLVNLVSYCAEDNPFTRMLIFEYASNGSLFEHLHRKVGDPLSWSTRMRIIMGAAYGLQYMHHELQPPTSHMNFNSNAVFLTEDFAAKLAEFVAVTKAAVVRSDRRMFRSSKSSGGMDYDDTEGSDRHSPDFQENVYNFGVLLLEVVTGRLPYCDKEGSLVHWAGQYISAPENLDYMVDRSLESFDRSQLLAVCQVARLCTDPHRRFTMKEATKMLAMSLKITPEIAAPKGSLLWAELAILS